MFCYSTTTVIFFGASNIIGTNSWMVLDFYKNWFSYQKQHYLAKAERIDILLVKVMKKELNIHWLI